MSTTSTTTPPPARFDSEGRLLPWSDAEQAQHAEAVREGMARLAEIPDEPGENDCDFFRAMDADRPERPLFEGYH